MSLPPAEIAIRIRDSFSPEHAELLEAAIAEVLAAEGVGRNEAGDQAAAKLPAVFHALRGFDERELDFAITEGSSPRLVGRARPSARDTDDVKRLRLLSSRDSKHSMRRLTYELGDELFVGVCNRIMHAHQASASFATGNGDEGGIDLYGRIPLRLQDPSVPASLLKTTPLGADLLFLGQAKCYNPETARIGPDKMDEFAGAINRCLAKYEGQARKPSKRVPEDYYRTDENAIGLYFTTASYTGGASQARRDIVLVDGLAIAEFLIAHGICISVLGDVVILDAARLRDWAIEGLVYRPQPSS